MTHLHQVEVLRLGLFAVAQIAEHILRVQLFLFDFRREILGVFRHDFVALFHTHPHRNECK